MAENIVTLKDTERQEADKNKVGPLSEMPDFGDIVLKSKSMGMILLTFWKHG
jgi:hypothetical protein